MVDTKKLAQCLNSRLCWKWVSNARLLLFVFEEFGCNQSIYCIFHAAYILGSRLVKNIKFQLDNVAMSSRRTYVICDLEEG